MPTQPDTLEHDLAVAELCRVGERGRRIRRTVRSYYAAQQSAVARGLDASVSRQRMAKALDVSVERIDKIVAATRKATTDAG